MKSIEKIFLLIIIFFSILIGDSFAKYKSEVQGQVYANIAKPILEVKRDKTLPLTAITPKAIYEFEVRNFKDDKINEVDMEYYIQIVGNTNNAIQISLYNENEQIPLTENITENIKLSKEEKEIHFYHLEIIYDKTKEKEEKDINENIEVKICAVQKI